MPKKPKYEAIRCNHFSWRLSRRDKVWYADGRTNAIKVGRHSLNTRDKAEALRLLVHLDESCAVKFGLIEGNKALAPTVTDKLTLAEGRRLYEEHIGRSRITGGVKDSTKKRYRTVFDKFLLWAGKHSVAYFSQVNATALSNYAAHLEKLGYAQKTLLNELTTLKQCVRWLIEAGHLVDCEPIQLKLRKVESQRAYCYRQAEVVAILKRCRQEPSLGWIGDTVTALAYTGMRIEELANLKWSDVDLEGDGRISLADESGRRASEEPRRTLKSGSSRGFPLHSDLRQVLERLPKIDQYVFHGPRGGRLKPDFMRRMFIRNVLKPLAGNFPANGGQGFVDGRLHSFRHFFVSMCAAKNVPERVVMEWVGHADSAMVRHYFHLHDEEARRYMASLSLFDGAAGCSDGQVPKS